MSVRLQHRPNNKKIWHNWCHIKYLSLNRTEQNFIHIPKGLKANEDIIIRYVLYSWWKGNDQELIQSNSTSCPKHRMRKEQNRLRQHRVKQHKRKARRAALSQQMATKLTVQNIIENKFSALQILKYVCMGHKSQHLYAVLQLAVLNSKVFGANSNFSVCTPTFHRSGFLNSNFQNPNENSDNYDQFVGLGMESKALVHWCSKTHVPWGRCWGQTTALIWAPISPASWEARVRNDMCCEKRGHLFISQHSLIKKKKKNGENLCFLVEFSFLAQTAWSFLSGFSIRLVLGHLLTHSVNQAPHSLKAWNRILFKK